MSTTRRDERALLGVAAFEVVAPTHYPEIEALSAEDLRMLATRLREQHARARDLLREGRRARRGKGDARGAATAEHGKLAQRKQVYAGALKRVNSRFDALTAERRQAEHRAALKAALARKQGARAAHPQGGPSANGGMRANPSGKRRGGVNPGRIGSVSQQNKAAQARRDA